MKKTVITLVILIITGVFISLNAQTTIDGLYGKYAGQKGFTSINISPEMFSMLSSLNTEDSAENAKEAQNIMEQLSGLKMLVYESDSLQTNQAFLKDVRELNKVKGFSELMSINSENEVVKFLVKKGNDGKVSEMLMLVFDKNEAMVMSLTGDLDMSTISGISKSLDIEGMDKLKKLDEK
ncbi:MAG TPA: DUF4252 domain-containing protein [Bacteroidetes bacterium]|nr:DUF4252 domain-containing protein [Bacteroidota bacterium]